jgi:hypothetical protein
MRPIILAAILALSAGTAQAATLSTGSNTLPGTTSALEPQLAGLVVEDDLQAFSWTQAGGTLRGTIQSRVVLSNDNTYDFYWRVRDLAFDGSGPMQDIGNFRIGTFGVPIAGLNGNYRTDGLGNVGPSTAFVFNGGLSDYVNFSFGPDTLGLGEESYFMFLDTSSTRYARNALMDVANADTTSIGRLYSTFGVGGVPEPATWAMMIAGFGFVGGAMRRRQSAVGYASA